MHDRFSAAAPFTVGRIEFADSIYHPDPAAFEIEPDEAVQLEHADRARALDAAVVKAIQRRVFKRRAASEPQGITVRVVLTDGETFEYTVTGEDAATRVRDHTHQIVTCGYRSTRDGKLTHYPPHRIHKVEATGPGITTGYPEKRKGT